MSHGVRTRAHNTIVYKNSQQCQDSLTTMSFAEHHMESQGVHMTQLSINTHKMLGLTHDNIN
jgi:hypothetical protein